MCAHTCALKRWFIGFCSSAWGGKKWSQSSRAWKLVFWMSSEPTHLARPSASPACSLKLAWETRTHLVEFHKWSDPMPQVSFWWKFFLVIWGLRDSPGGSLVLRIFSAMKFCYDCKVNTLGVECWGNWPVLVPSPGLKKRSCWMVLMAWWTFSSKRWEGWFTCYVVLLGKSVVMITGFPGVEAKSYISRIKIVGEFDFST